MSQRTFIWIVSLFIVLAVGAVHNIDEASDPHTVAAKAVRDSLSDDDLQCRRMHGEAVADQRPNGEHRCRNKHGAWLTAGAK